MAVVNNATDGDLWSLRHGLGQCYLDEAREALSVTQLDNSRRHAPKKTTR
jgi:hypothetical protein